MKFKKIICIALVGIMSLLGTSSVLAENEDNNTKRNQIQFVTTDENGNEVVEDLVYIDFIAEAYENQKHMRWPATTYWNLGSSAYTMSGGSALMVTSDRHFYANSANRIYYHGETTGRNAYVSLYDVTAEEYAGSFLLVDQGNNVFSRTGYFSGLGSNVKYSVGVISKTTNNFSSFYTTVAWNAL